MKKTVLGLLAGAVAIGFALVAIFLLQSRGEQKNDETIHLRLSSFALYLNPLKMADVESRRVATLLYSGLVFQNQSGKVTPVLAQSWTHEGNLWKFTLKNGVSFTDGSPVTADVVINSLCRSMQPSAPFAWSLQSIEHKVNEDGKTVDCIGLKNVEGEVHVTETSPVPWLLDALSGPAGWILPGQLKEESYGILPGTGPYEVEEILPDSKVVLKARQKGVPLEPQAVKIVFDYIPDDAAAVASYAAGKLDVLDLTSPQLVDLMTENGKLRFPGDIAERNWDRVRVAIINEKILKDKGFSEQQVRDFIDDFRSKVNRKQLVAIARGTARELKASFPPAAGMEGAEVMRSVDDLNTPVSKLSIITEADTYSDYLAASLPKQISNTSIDYRGVEKGVLMSTLLQGKAEIASILIEAPVHSPVFWASFFTPGNPFVVIGKAIPGFETLDLTRDEDVKKAGILVSEQGNWVPLLLEKRRQVTAPRITGIVFSLSGQANYSQVIRD